MCGIVYINRLDNKPAAKTTLKRYHNQKKRGQAGYGYIAIDDAATPIRIERAQHESEITKKLNAENARQIVFHHRQPTSTANVIESAHPIAVINDRLKYNYYIVHNGIIYNDKDLKTGHIKKGFIYSTLINKRWYTRITTYAHNVFNDSEAFAIDFALAYENIIPNMESLGASAFIAVKTAKNNKPIEIIFGRNNINPLVIIKQKELMAVTSEGGGVSLPADELLIMDIKTGAITKRRMSVGKNTPTDSFGLSTMWEDYCSACHIHGHSRYDCDVYIESISRKTKGKGNKAGFLTVGTPAEPADYAEDFIDPYWNTPAKHGRELSKDEYMELLELQSEYDELYENALQASDYDATERYGAIIADIYGTIQQYENKHDLQIFNA